MKKQILNIALGIAAMLVVSTSYAAAKNSTASDNGYTLQSVVDGHETTAAFDKNGNWVYTIHRYTPDNLDKNIITKIKDGYDKYSINGMQKIEQPGQDTVYVAYLENATTVKTIRICNDEVELVQDYSKQ